MTNTNDTTIINHNQEEINNKLKEIAEKFGNLKSKEAQSWYNYSIDKVLRDAEIELKYQSENKYKDVNNRETVESDLNQPQNFNGDVEDVLGYIDHKNKIDDEVNLDEIDKDIQENIKFYVESEIITKDELELILDWCSGKTFEQIGTKLGKSKVAISKAMHRAFQKMELVTYNLCDNKVLSKYNSDSVKAIKTGETRTKVDYEREVEEKERLEAERGLNSVEYRWVNGMMRPIT